MTEKLVQSPTVVTAVAQELLRQGIGSIPGISRQEVWKAQREDTKAGYRARAVELLEVIDEVTAVR